MLKKVAVVLGALAVSWLAVLLVQRVRIWSQGEWHPCTNVSSNVYVRGPSWVGGTWCVQSMQGTTCVEDFAQVQRECAPGPSSSEAEAALDNVESSLRGLLERAAPRCPEAIAGPPAARVEAVGLEPTPVEELVALPEGDHVFPATVHAVEVRCWIDDEPDTPLERGRFAPLQLGGRAPSFECGMSSVRYPGYSLSEDDAQGTCLEAARESPFPPHGCGPGKWLLASVRRPLATGGSIEAKAWLDLDGARPGLQPKSDTEQADAQASATQERGYSARLSLTDASIRGSLARDALEPAVSKVAEGMLQCLTADIEQERVVKLRMIMAPSGNVQSSNLSGTTFDDTQVAQCMVERTREIEFPAPEDGGIAVIDLTLRLEPDAV